MHCDRQPEDSMVSFARSSTADWKLALQTRPVQEFDMVRTETALLITGAMVFSGLACTRGSADFNLEISTSEDMVTLIRANWQTDQAGVSWVDFGRDGELGFSTPQEEEPSTEHQFTLLGMHPLDNVAIEAFTQVDGLTMSVGGQVTIPNAPSSLPDLEVTVYDPERMDAAPYVLGVTQGSNLIFGMDREANWLWYKDLGDDYCSFELEPSPDGKSLFYNVFAYPFTTEMGAFATHAFDDSQYDEIVTDGAHHSFAVLPDGTVGFIIADIQDWLNPETSKYESVVGDTITELAPDGSWTEVYNTWGTLEVVPHDSWNVVFYTEGHDWTHGNSLYYYEDTNTYLLSLGNIDLVLEVDRATGDILRSFGPDGEYTFAEGTEPFDFQHDVHWTDDGNLIMTTMLDGTRIIAAEYSVDESTKTMTRIWSHGEDDTFYAIALGQASRLPNGNTLVSFGTAGTMREVTPEGDIVWEVQGDVGMWFSKVILVDDLYNIQWEQ